jgi:hypothetical protein
MFVYATAYNVFQHFACYNCTVCSGVPQGGVIGPLMFLLFINDLPDYVKSCNVKLFADDCIMAYVCWWYIKADTCWDGTPFASLVPTEVNYPYRPEVIACLMPYGFSYTVCNQIDLILLDFSKAFDKVPHERLLYKAQYYGIDGSTLLWIRDFLSSREYSMFL